MGRVEVKHYPASKLPDELPDAFGVNSLENIVVEEDTSTLMPMTREELKKMIYSANKNGPEITMEEAVARIRALRDEWDD